MSNIIWKKKPAIVCYIGKSNTKFTYGRQYEAFFLEYWQGKRNSLHVRDNDCRVTDFNPFEDFEVICDEDNILNTYEAIVRCKTNMYDGLTFGVTSGNEYKAIGRDKEGLYLVMDDSYDCYFYPPDIFEIVQDQHGILSCRSVYYSFNGGDETIKY